MTRAELLASEYAFTQCESNCEYRSSSCSEACGEFNICRLDYLAGYKAAENDIKY